GYRQEALLEFMRLEGRGDCGRLTYCPSCLRTDSVEPGSPLYRCEECLGTKLECGECILRHHGRQPFHAIQRWNGSSFHKVTLQSLGLRVQVGHEMGGRCVNPKPAPADFTVIHTNGIHRLSLDFCWCEHRVAPWKQLLRAELFPATVDQPKTCASFRLLEQFQAVSGSGKVSAYEYHQALKQMTDATGINKPKSKYKSLARLTRQFAHMKMLKRAGRGNVEDGIKTTVAGGLALLCPACPRPGVNLLPDWESAPLEYKFLYILILALDANFRLKNLFRSSIEKDPGLHTGLAYFVNPGPYLAHVSRYATQKDISTCSGFKTLSHAESKNAVGLWATGVGMCICARHEMVRPLGVGDLQKGERYCNMDYIALSAAHDHGLKSIFFSYDIACQWKLNFFEHMTAFPCAPEFKAVDIQFGIPKCHCKGHKLKCQCYHAMQIQIIGRTDGEGIERAWSEINVVVNSTKEMGPGNRWDKLDVQFARHNWHKTIGLGTSVKAVICILFDNASRHMTAFLELTEVLPEERFKMEWKEEIEKWEKNQSLPSPYFIEVKQMTEAQVLLSLKEDERLTVVSDGTEIDDSMATACIEVGLAVEDMQRRLLEDIRDNEETLGTAKDIQNKRLTVHKHLRQLRDLQSEFMPCVKAQLRRAVGESRDVEHHKLWLPSDLNPVLREKGCLAGVGDIEAKLREAQCLDALATLRSALRARHSLFARRNKNFRGQKQSMRAADAAHRLDRKCKLMAAKYNIARAALKVLRGAGPWEDSLRELKAGDITSLHGSVLEIDDAEEDEPAGPSQKRRKTAKEVGEGHREISWIWIQEGALGDGQDEKLNQAVKLEWLKSRARAHHWREECLLLTEEKRRTLESFRFTAQEWDNRESGWHGLDAAVQEGVMGYARRQASVYRSLELHFRKLWDMPIEEVLEGENDSETETEDDGQGDRNCGEEHIDAAEMEG
ncbi:hypothetical protein ARMSODRAFT_893876, partial [Armillaria solidipes]